MSKKVKFAVGAADLSATGRQTLIKLSQDIAKFSPSTIAVRNAPKFGGCELAAPITL